MKFKLPQIFVFTTLNRIFADKPCESGLDLSTSNVTIFCESVWCGAFFEAATISIHRRADRTWNTAITGTDRTLEGRSRRISHNYGGLAHIMVNQKCYFAIDHIVVVRICYRTNIGALHFFWLLGDFAWSRLFLVLMLTSPPGQQCWNRVHPCESG